MRRAACVGAVLALAVCEGCSVYDESLATAGPDVRTGDTGAGETDALPDASSGDEGDEREAPEPVGVEAGIEAAEDEGPQSDAADAVVEEIVTTQDAVAEAGLPDRDAGPDEPNPPVPRPVDVVLGATSTPSGQQSPTASGNPFSQTCMPNEVVIGYSGTVGGPDGSIPVLRTFRAICGSLSVTGAAAFTVTTTTAETLPVVGISAGPTQQVQMCNANEMVIGFSGRSGSDIDQIVILCAPLIISGSAPAYALSVGVPNARPPLGGPGGNSFPTTGCPSGQVAVGNEGRAAFTINAFGLLCRPPVLVVQ